MDEDRSGATVAAKRQDDGGLLGILLQILFVGVLVWAGVEMLQHQRRQIGDLGEQKRDLSALLRMTERENRGLSSEIAQWKILNASQEGRIAALEHAERKSLSETTHLKLVVSGLRQELGSKVVAFRNKEDRLQEVIAFLQGEVATAEQSAAQMLAELAVKNSQIADLGHQGDTLPNQRGTARQDFADLIEEHRRSKEQVEELRGHLAQMLEEVNSLNEEVEILQEENAAYAQNSRSDFRADGIPVRQTPEGEQATDFSVSSEIPAATSAPLSAASVP